MATRTPRAATHFAAAGPNQQAADAAAAIYDAGGNAVDAAVAATFVTMVNEPGIVSIGGGAFVTVLDDAVAMTYDGNVAMPSGDLAGVTPEALWDVTVAYGSGVTFAIGPASAAVPGAVAALGTVHAERGRLPWSTVLTPAISVAEAGFPLSPASSHYLPYVHESVYGYDTTCAAMMQAARDNAGDFTTGHWTVLPGIAAVLQHLADHGADDLYHGDLAQRLVADQQRRGGLITQADLTQYQVTVGPSLPIHMGEWTFHTNPPPAIGGTVLAAVLREALSGQARGVDHPLERALEAMVVHRARVLDLTDDLDAATRELLAAHPDVSPRASGATVHISTVDDTGDACSITASAGYGSGCSVDGSGLLLNNCLGEYELNRRGLLQYRPGQRLASNMAPTVARHADGGLLAIGSPGADRITTALAYVLWQLSQGADLGDAVTGPRCHAVVDQAHRTPDTDGPAHVADPADDAAADHVLWHVEPGGTVPNSRREKHWETPNMYFGGVGAALRRGDGTVLAVADPRRGGGVVVR